MELKYRILCGNASEKLDELEVNSVQTWVTSVPYWGLRAYLDHPDEIGREPTLDQWLVNLVYVFRAAKKSLRPDGTLWVNCGDAYAGSWGNYGAREGNQRSRISERYHRPAYEDPRKGYKGLPPTAHPGNGLKNKDLIGLPHRLAFALQSDGWYLRSAIVWAKGIDWSDKEREAQETIRQSLAAVRLVAEGSLFGLGKVLDAALKKAEKAVDRLAMSGAVMPESIQDRPTSAYEMLFLFSQSERYYYDHHAVKVSQSPHSHSRGDGHTLKEAEAGHGIKANASFHEAYSHNDLPAGRNARNVWRIAVEPRGAFLLSSGKVVSHFAAYPEALAARAIRAATSKYGACAKCGTPFKRIVTPTPQYAQHLGQDWADYEQDEKEGRGHSVSDQRPVKRNGEGLMADYMTMGWVPTCTCYGHPIAEAVACPKCDGTGKERGYPQAQRSDGSPYGISSTTSALHRSGGAYETLIKSGGDGLVETGHPCPKCLCPDCKGTGQALTTRSAKTETTYARGTMAGRLALLRQTARQTGGEYSAAFQGIPTGTPCPTCNGIGATGKVNGEVWHPETLEAWPIAPCVVGDMFGGTGATGRAAAGEGCSSILVDLDPDCCELMQERMDAWPGDVEQVKSKKKKKMAEAKHDPQMSFLAVFT
jgi:DNA modification methylase